ncbi:MAG: MBL fold metallo-hydrolase [Dehalococcoidia bacterium]|nr:MAG: MBL fold metallo-hydrolase [Dehalococcoidia bacterium]
MEIQILGAHLAEQKGARLTSLLIDSVLVVDAGGLTSALSLPEQEKIETVLLTHHHFDHTRDLVTLAANAGYYWRKQLVVYAPRYTLDIVTSCLLDGKIYANYLEYPSKEKPTLILEAIEPYGRKTVGGYDVLAVPVKHSVPTVGYQITSLDGKSLFCTGDTTVGISDCWQHISPQLLISEVTGPNKYGDWLKKAGHLCAEFLKEELIQFRRLNGYLPRVIVIHIGNPFEQEIKEEVSQVAQELKADISLGYEDMKITL